MLDIPLRPVRDVPTLVAFLVVVPLFLMAAPWFVTSDGEGLEYVVFMSGVAWFPCGLFRARAIVRLCASRDCRFRLDTKTVAFPVASMFGHQNVNLELSQVDEVGLGFAGRRPAIQLRRGNKLYRIPGRWFPAEWNYREVARTIERVRSAAPGRIF